MDCHPLDAPTPRVVTRPSSNPPPPVVREGHPLGLADLGCIIDNRNQKGTWALHLLAMEDLRAMNSYFQHKSYTAHVSNLPPCGPQMLDVISVSSKAAKRVRDCKVFKHGLPSDHSAVVMGFSITSIKHSGEAKVSKGVIDWDKIAKDPELRKQFNDAICELCDENTTYSS